ncbi:MAG: branched-chain amino acid ABC transporter permease [Anaerolineae bacterium]|nr:branched-chain amino acid ABC transporter permease [Anaerolineae bacterium]
MAGRSGNLFSSIFRPVGRIVSPVWTALRRQLAQTPVLAFQLGVLVAVLLEQWQGEAFADLLGFRRIPRFFGIVDIFEPFSDLDFSGILAPFFPSPNNISASPLQDSVQALGELATTFVKAFFYQGPRAPGFFDVTFRVLIYDIVVFVVPILIIAFLLRPLVSELLRRFPKWSLILVHLIILAAIVLLWGDDGGTRELVLIFMGINIILTVSLNLVNGYMGEFSVGHAAFMAVGAYVSSVMTMWAFVDDRVFGAPALDPSWGLPVGFAIALFAGGIAAAIAALLVAFPSFRTRGDYLAIVTLAVNFIVQSAINNMEGIGGARGLNGVPLWSDLSWVLLTTILSVFIIHSLVNSTFGKGIIAIREDEIASELMGVNTKRIKLVTFLVSSFFAGVAGGLFAHVLAYINPGNFGILKSTEVLVMVYLGGMGSISGSIIAAIIFTLLLEALRPLAILKWVVIPLILIVLMLFRPQGLFGFREIELNWGWQKAKEKPEVSGATAED